MARALLLQNEWNADLAIRKFSEDVDYIEKTFNFEIGTNQMPKLQDGPGDDILCPVCFCDYPLSEFEHLPDCAHGLCTYCYAGYLGSKVSDGVESVMTTCPERGCNMIVPERLFRKLLEPEQVSRYMSFLLKSFVDLSKQSKWCPRRDCTMAVESKSAQPVDVRCTKCSLDFCFGCNKDAHMPIDCDGLQAWEDRLN